MRLRSAVVLVGLVAAGLGCSGDDDAAPETTEPDVSASLGAPPAATVGGWEPLDSGEIEGRAWSVEVASSNFGDRCARLVAEGADTLSGCTDELVFEFEPDAGGLLLALGRAPNGTAAGELAGDADGVVIAAPFYAVIAPAARAGALRLLDGDDRELACLDLRGPSPSAC